MTALRLATIPTAAAMLLLLTAGGHAQTAPAAPPVAPSPGAPAPAAPAPAASASAAAASAAPDKLVLYFDTGSVAVRAQDQSILDHASRLYRDGKPIVMIVSGATDSVGSPDTNLRLSAARAQTVLQALVARGIPAERFQLLAKGETDPAVPTPTGTPEPGNRRVEISWR